LGIGKASLGDLHTLPMHQLLAAQVQMEQADRLRGEAPRAFMPVVDGVALPRHPYDPDAPEMSDHVPMVISTTLDERAYRQVNFDLDEVGLKNFFTARAGPDANKLLAMYRAEDPGATPYVLQARLDTDMTFRLGAHAQSERKAAKGRAPVWTYLWKIPSAAYGGRYGAPHGVDIGPSLHDIRHGLNGPTAENLRLADQLASAWVAFAASGDPNNARTPPWPAFTLPERTTMVFEGSSNTTQAQADPRKAFREYWSAR
jgi:para-nitrobenzyl esterase